MPIVKMINELCEQFSLDNKNRNWLKTTFSNLSNMERTSVAQL